MPPLDLMLRGMIQAEPLARALFERLFPERAIDLARVVVDQRAGDTREVRLGSVTDGLLWQTTFKMQTTRDDEIEVEGDPVFLAGDESEGAWLRIDASWQGSRVRIRCDDEVLLASLTEDVFRIGCGMSPAAYAALGVMQRLRGFGQDAWGRGPSALESVRVAPSALDPRVDATLAEDLGLLDRAAAEGSHRAALAAAVLVARNGDLAGALTRIEAIQRAKPDEPDAAGMRLLLLVRSGRSEEALAEARAFTPGDERAFLAKVFALVELGALEDAIALLDGPLPSGVHETHACLVAAALTERAGDRPGALARARALAAREPSIARTFAERGFDPNAMPLPWRLGLGAWWSATYPEVTQPVV